MKIPGMRAALLSLCAVALSFSSCTDKIVKNIFTAFLTETYTVDFQIPIVSFAPFSLDSVAVSGEPMNIDSLVKDQSKGAFGLDDVKAVYLDELKIVLDSADEANNLSNFSAVRLTLKSADGRNAVEVCNTTIPDEFASERSLAIYDDRDLKPVLSSSSLIYVVGVDVRRQTTKVLNGKLSFRFDVK